MTKTKNYNIEFLRFIATLGVVFVHVGICWISYYGKNASNCQKTLSSIVQHSCFWAVPVFMMITGTLMMHKESIGYRKALHYFIRIGILVAIFGTAFAWMELFFKSHQFNLNLITNGFLMMLEGKSWKHLWYLYMLLGVYLILPVLNKIHRLPPLHY